ncbi:MAG: hypothetical protein AB1505_05680 [Candidatus Latescibacterota bacterium]
MAARGWVIADNVLVGIRGRTGGARGAVFVWQGSQDVRIERNVILDCDSGMWLGLAWPPEDTRHCARHEVRNNFVAGPRCTGILLNRHVDSRVVHNTVYDPVPLAHRPAGTDIEDGGVLGEAAEPRCRPLRLGVGHRGLLVANNLLCGPGDLHVSETAGEVRLWGNRWLQEPDPGVFGDVTNGDLHLARGAARGLAVGAAVEGVTEDIDRRPRGGRPTVGAHEGRAA